MWIIPLNFSLNDVLLTGFSGASAVAFQSSSMVWAENLIRKQRGTNHSLIQCASKMIK